MCHIWLHNETGYYQRVVGKKKCSITTIHLDFDAGSVTKQPLHDAYFGSHCPYNKEARIIQQPAPRNKELNKPKPHCDIARE